MKRWLFFMANCFGLCELLRWLNRRKVVILCYHGVTHELARALEDPDGLHVHRERFLRHMRYLAKHYHPISLAQLVRHLERQTPPPSYSVVVTFDDGFRDVPTHGLPILRQYRIPATVFVVTDHISSGAWLWTDQLAYALAHTPERSLNLGELSLGPVSLRTSAERRSVIPGFRRWLKSLSSEARQRILTAVFRLARVKFEGTEQSSHDMMNWEEVAVLCQAGIEIGCHSANHPSLTKEDEGVLEHEVIDAKGVLESRLGCPVQAFAYPNGDYNERIVQTVKRAGYRCAVTTKPGFNTVSSDPYKLKRILVGNDDDIWSLKASLGGLRLFTSWVADRLRAIGKSERIAVKGEQKDSGSPSRNENDG